MRRRDLLSMPAAAVLPCCGRKGPRALRRVSAGVLVAPGISPLHQAIERGYFRDAGLLVEPQNLNSGAQMVTLLAAGRLDAGLMFVPPAMFNAAAQGSKVRVVLGREFVNPACGDAASLYARKAAFPKGTSDLHLWIGKRIASGSRAGMGEFVLDTIMRSIGLDLREIANANVGHAEAAAALVSGKVDALINSTNLPLDFSSHPEIVHEKAGAKAIAGLQLSYVLFGPTLIEGDVSAGSAFVACYLRGLRDFMAGATPQYLKDYVRTQGRDAAVLNQCRTYCTADGRVDIKSVQTMLDWAIARGYTPSGTHVENVVDNRFWEIARKEVMNS